MHPQPEGYWGNVNPIGPRACYDEAKRCAETLFFDYHHQHRTPIRVARIFNTYGPRMHPDDGRVVSNFVVRALRGEPLVLYGDGSQTRSFCYVDDLVEGVLRFMDLDADLPGPLNLGNPDEIAIRTLAEQVVTLCGSRSPVVCRERLDDDPARRRPDIRLARERLGWEPGVALHEGLRTTIDYFAGLAPHRAAGLPRAGEDPRPPPLPPEPGKGP